MSLRVSHIKSINKNVPVVIIAPFGNKHLNTDFISETIIDTLSCTGIINHGWEKSLHFDYFKDKADCFNLDHIKCEVIKDEFYDPIINSYNNYLNLGHIPMIFIISGIVNKFITDRNMDLLISNGYDKSITCADFYKYLFLTKCQTLKLNAFKTSSVSIFNDASNNCLTQILNDIDNKYFDLEKNCMHIRISESIRSDKTIAKQTAFQLSNCISYVVKARNDPFGTYSIETNRFNTI